MAVRSTTGRGTTGRGTTGRGRAAAAALALCLAGGVAGAGTATAAPGFRFDERIAGNDRYDTAVRASQAAFRGSTGSVVVVNADATADGLSASYVAGQHDAPILYTTRDSVPEVTLAEIRRLGARQVYVLGGTAVVSQGVEDVLEAVNGGATVTRYGGEDRYSTAALAATSVAGYRPAKVLVASGTSLADALALGPLAYRKKYPLVLTRAASVPDATRDALATLDGDFLVAAGGPAVISDATAAELGVGLRLAGQDRQETAVAVRDYVNPNEQFVSTNAALVGGEDRNAADALAAAPLAGKVGVAILFTSRAGVVGMTRDHLVNHAPGLTGTGYVFGGLDAVPQAVADQATAAAQ